MLILFFDIEQRRNEAIQGKSSRMQNVEVAEDASWKHAPQRARRRCRRLLWQMLHPIAGADARAFSNELIDHFGSLRATLAATPQEQHAAIGDRRVVRYLGVIKHSMCWTLRDAVDHKNVLTSTSALREHLRFNHGSDRAEKLRVFYLNVAGALIREVCFEQGASDHVKVNIGLVIRHGLNLDANMLVMAHNHPSGDPRPSKPDYDVTRKIATAANLVGMCLYEHLIVAEGADFSFRENGLL